MKEGTQRATKGSVEEGVGWGGAALQFLVFSPLSLSSLWLSLVAVAIFVCFSLLTN